MTGGAQDSGVGYGTCRKCGFDLALAPGIDTYCPNKDCGDPVAEMRAAVKANLEARERAEYERLKAKFETRATPAPAGWQPIESAPRDGTQILAELQAGYFDVISFWASSWRENANGLALRNPPLRWTAILTAPAEGGV